MVFALFLNSFCDFIEEVADLMFHGFMNTFETVFELLAVIFLTLLTSAWSQKQLLMC